MEEKLVSIIVPVYNNAKYLEKCLDSILIQTYNNLEIIVIDDGSNDGSEKICDDYAYKDNRVKVYHKKNTGVSDSRNYGLKNTNGEFISFVDADDYLDKDFVLTLYKNIINTKSDISICGQYRVFGNYNKRFYDKDTFFIEENNVLNSLISQKYFQGHMFDKMYKKELFSDIKFSKKVIYYEDLLINYNIFKKAKKIVYDSTPLYYYFQNPSSALNCGYNKEKMVFIKICEEIKSYYKMKQYDLGYINSLTDYLYICNANDIASKYSNNFEEEYTQFVKFIRTHIFRILLKDEISIKHKIVSIILFLNKRIYISIAKIIKEKDLKKY